MFKAICVHCQETSQVLQHPTTCHYHYCNYFLFHIRFNYFLSKGKECTDIYEFGEIREKIYGGKIFNTINIKFDNPLKDLDLIRHGMFDFSDLFHHIVKLLKP